MSPARTMRLVALTFLAAVAACSADDSTRPNVTGPPQVARDVGAAATGLVITEVLSDPTKVSDSAGEWFELYNPTAAPIDLQGYQITTGPAGTDTHALVASVVVPAGGYAVLGNNADFATNGNVTIAYAYPAAITLNNSNTDWIRINAPDNSVVDSVSYSARDAAGVISTPTFSPTAGTSRGVLDAAADNSVLASANWANATSTFGLGDKGTPGAPNDGGSPPPPPPPPPTTGDVVINEILANPSAVLDNVGEWFEVYNRGTAAVDLQGWTIASNNDAPHVIASSAVLPVGGYAVIARNADPAVNGGVTVAYAYDPAGTGLNLSNTADFIALRDGSGATIDSVAYAAAAPNGASRALTDAASDNTNVDGSEWFTSFPVFGAGDRGTPGAVNVSGPPPTPGEVASISLGVTAPAEVPVGYTKPLFPTTRDGFGTVVSPPPPLTWSSSDLAVATVDTLGYVTGTGAGTATISAAAPNGVSGSINFTILPAVAPTSAVYRNHLEFGTPIDGTPADDILIAKAQYSLSYSVARGAPNWVSWNLNATQFGPEDRCNCFSADNTLPANVYRVVDFDYRNGGYDRGHLVQSFSRTTTDQENATTFLLTNILPQAAENNQGPWAAFEVYLNDLALQQSKEVYVVAGGEYEANAPTLKNEGKVQIPAFTWKVALIVDAGEGLGSVQTTADVQVIAIRMPNYLTTATGIRNTPWQTFTTTVDFIESRVGYDVLSALPDPIEALVESNDRPPVADVGGPYAGNEGGAVSFSGSGSSDPDGDVLTYAWSLGDGGTTTGSVVQHTYADDGTYTVTLTVTDPYGLTSSSTTTAIIANIAPTIATFTGATLLVGETYSATGSFADPGSDSWTATVDYGDGGGPASLPTSARTFSLSHRYTSSGDFTVSVTVRDDDSGSGSGAAAVKVLTAVEGVAALIAQVNALVTSGALPQQSATSLLATLAVAERHLLEGRNRQGSIQLGVFNTKVAVLVLRKELSQSNATILAAFAGRIALSALRN